MLDGQIDLIMGKKAILKYHMLDIFTIHFGLETTFKTRYPQSARFTVSARSVLTAPHHMILFTNSPSISSYLWKLTIMFHWRVDWRSIFASPYYRSLKISISHHRHPTLIHCCQMASSIHEVGEAEDSSYDDEYLSDDQPLVQGFIGMRVVLEGSRAPEQLALREITQGFFLERLRHSDEMCQSKGSSSTKQGILTLGVGKPKKTQWWTSH